MYSNPLYNKKLPPNIDTITDTFSVVVHFLVTRLLKKKLILNYSVAIVNLLKSKYKSALRGLNYF